MRPSVKQAALLKYEEKCRLSNERRVEFWKALNNVFVKTRDLLALKKQEKKGAYADNTILDEELGPLYLDFCGTVFPLVEPYVHMVQEQQNELDNILPTPLDSKDVN